MHGPGLQAPPPRAPAVPDAARGAAGLCRGGPAAPGRRIYIYIYIYIYRERERERDRYTHVCMYVCMYICMYVCMYVYIYIYI